MHAPCDTTKPLEFQDQRVSRIHSEWGQGKPIAKGEVLSLKDADSSFQSSLMPELVTAGEKRNTEGKQDFGSSVLK